MATVQNVPLSPRAKQSFNQRFKPKYEKYLTAVKQTVLMILVWGPGAGAHDEYGKRVFAKRQQIRDELRRRGHAAFFSEELERAVKTPGQSLKAIEFAQAQSADLIVVMDASYGSVAEVHDFAPSRVVNFKMLIFIDAAAKDGYSYRGALKDLNDVYDNVKTYKYPEDIVECHLLTKIMKKVDALQRLAHYEETTQQRRKTVQREVA